MFHVGQRVEYIGPDVTHFAKAYGQIVPVPRTPYTVRAVSCIADQEALLLNEIVNVPQQWLNGIAELHINAVLFRPIVERGTDISIFLKMLTPSQVDA